MWLYTHPQVAGAQGPVSVYHLHPTGYPLTRAPGWSGTKSQPTVCSPSCVPQRESWIFKEEASFSNYTKALYELAWLCPGAYGCRGEGVQGQQRLFKPLVPSPYSPSPCRWTFEKPSAGVLIPCYKLVSSVPGLLQASHELGQRHSVTVLQSSPGIVTGWGSGLQGHFLQQPFDYHTTISILTSAKMFTHRGPQHVLPPFCSPPPPLPQYMPFTQQINVFADSGMWAKSIGRNRTPWSAGKKEGWVER